APNHIVRFLKAERVTLAGHPLMNSWGWGGYLGYWLYPTYPIFWDGRFIFHHLLHEYPEARSAPALPPKEYWKFLDRHRIDIVLWKRGARIVEQRLPGRPRWSRKFERPSYVVYLPQADWALVSWDSDGGVFVRRSAFPASWIAAREYTALRFDDFEALAAQAKAGEVRRSVLAAETERFAREHPKANVGGIQLLLSELERSQPPAR
ncbi:MAG TPA: hypothetical protein VNI01_01840, partial [Elusimicrobiota bacterium]|nr:hypothetical protein [Elusimicrobiota bacterium]